MTDQNALADQVLTLGINDISDTYGLAFTATYICGGKTFQILVAGDPPPGYEPHSTDTNTQPPEVAWTEQLLDLSMHDGTDPAKLIAQDLFLQKLDQDIKRIALPRMLELALPPAPGSPPPRNPRRGVHTVYEHLCPDMVKLQLVSRDGCFELIDGHHSQAATDELRPIARSELEALGVEGTELEMLPTYAASEVLLLSQCMGTSAYYATNLGPTEQWVCKLGYRWCHEATLRELATLVKIRKSGMRLRTSTLKALVTYKDSIVGLLIDKIPTRYSSLDDVVTAPLSLRRKWAAQIEDTVKELHRLGIIWGDAKPGNVVIDECDDAWLIDFGGGFTPPWVDTEFIESVEGDLQAVNRIRERLEDAED